MFSSREVMNYLNATDTEVDMQTLRQIMRALNVILGYFARKEALLFGVVINSDFYVRPGSHKSSLPGYILELSHQLSIKAHAVAARVLVHVETRCIPCLHPGPLSVMMRGYMSHHTSQIDRLENILRGIRVHIMPSVRNYQGRSFATTVKIRGLATCNNGALLQHPPKVARYGAGPQEVEIFIESRQTLGAASPLQGGYVTLAVFFEKGWPFRAPHDSINVANEVEYNITSSPDMPIVNVGTPERPIYFPVEAGQPVSAASFSAHEYRPAQGQSETAIMRARKRLAVMGLNFRLNRALTAFGIKASSDPVTVNSRVLTAPRVRYARETSARVAQGMWNVNAYRLMKSVTLRSWSWIYLDPLRGDSLERKSTTLTKPLHQLATVLRRMGIFTSGFIPGKVVRFSNGHAKDDIKDTISFLQEKYRPSIILVILSTRAKRLGDLARFACDIDHGMPAIEFTDEWLAEADQERYARLGLRMNLKLGGENHMVSASDLDFVANDKTMIVGINVVFARSGSQGSFHTVVGLVASSCSRLSQWPAEISVQIGKDPLIRNLDEMLGSRIRYWARNHDNMLPQDIVIYRSMVSGGKYGAWVDQELPLIKNACRASKLTENSQGDLPRITVVLVDKSHDARFHPTADTEGHSSGSPLAGTVVDRGISEPRQWDFFLQSHSPTQGPNQPTRYFVIFDEVFRRRCCVRSNMCGPVDLLQNLTHTLCYLSGETTKAKSVCAPVHYAIRACARVRSYYSADNITCLSSGDHDAWEPGKVVKPSLLKIHPALQDSMFYL
ncbi:RNA interference and gene silencing protein [Penicillium samsonianum]|uniref:RNA interference and gene silencing protein n=1 Tax=Penicillium samsonianum TaxID=1882272 RepID=UPI00254771F3|nr:RNA interference and gene silencing protein [Penicillium samsonianum]KAJ6125862.1 RNA interference and gene silencing protein [Penicillium samsonianum]